MVVEEVLDMEPLMLFEMELLVVLVVVLDIWDQVVVDLVPHMVVLQELVILHHSPPHKVFLVEVEMAAVAVAVLLVLVVMEQVGQVEQGSAVSITGSSVTYSTGGEGNGATAGSASTGDGGDSDLNDSGENGGSGIVIVRYTIGNRKKHLVVLLVS